MNLRSRFSLLVDQPDLVYLDSASTTQRVDIVLARLDHYYREMNANVHRGLYSLSEKATTEYEAVRETVRAFIGARETAEILFTHGTTESLNMVAQGWGRQFLEEGDEVVLTILEHHSNLVPWQMMAKKTGAVLKFVGITESGELDYSALELLVGERTKMVSVTGLSNALGTLVDLDYVVTLAKKVGAKVCVDAAQLVAHRVVDVRKLDIDFLAFSSHKIYGPTGAGVLWARRELLEEMEPWLGGGDMIREVKVDGCTWNDIPWKFEAGTPPIAQVLGMGAAIEFLNEIGMGKIEAHDREIMEYAREKLATLEGVRLFGPSEAVGVLSFEVKGIHPHDVSAILAEQGVCVRAGHHCTMPLMKALGVVGTTRASFGVYTEQADVDRLVQGLEKVREMFA